MHSRTCFVFLVLLKDRIRKYRAGFNQHRFMFYDEKPEFRYTSINTCVQCYLKVKFSHLILRCFMKQSIKLNLKTSVLHALEETYSS